jgi:hypothetical protein
MTHPYLLLLSSSQQTENHGVTSWWTSALTTLDVARLDGVE